MYFIHIYRDLHNIHWPRSQLVTKLPGTWGNGICNHSLTSDQLKAAFDSFCYYVFLLSCMDNISTYMYVKRLYFYFYLFFISIILVFLQIREYSGNKLLLNLQTAERNQEIDLLLPRQHWGWLLTGSFDFHKFMQITYTYNTSFRKNELAISNRDQQICWAWLFTRANVLDFTDACRLPIVQQGVKLKYGRLLV